MNFPTNLSSSSASSPEEIEDPEIGEEAGGRSSGGDDGDAGAGAGVEKLVKSVVTLGGGTAVLLGMGGGATLAIKDVEVEGSSNDAGVTSAKK